MLVNLTPGIQKLSIKLQFWTFLVRYLDIMGNGESVLKYIFRTLFFHIVIKMIKKCANTHKNIQKNAPKISHTKDSKAAQYFHFFHKMPRQNR